MIDHSEVYDICETAIPVADVHTHPRAEQADGQKYGPAELTDIQKRGIDAYVIDNENSVFVLRSSAQNQEQYEYYDFKQRKFVPNAGG